MRVFAPSIVFIACVACAAHAMAVQDPSQDKAPKLEAVQQGDAQEEEDVEFNTDFLDPQMFRGLDKKKLGKSLAVQAGLLSVEVSLNNKNIGSMEVLFKDVEGSDSARACLSAVNIKKLPLKAKFYTPKGRDLLSDQGAAQASANPRSAPCLFIHELIEGASDKYDSSELALSLTVAQAAIAKQGAGPETLELSYGENAAFANYSASAFQIAAPGGKLSSQFLSLNAGFNLVPWQIRRSMSFSKSGDADVAVSYGDYLIKRTFLDWKSTLMLGKLSSQSQSLGGVSARGLRLSSEQQLYPYEERTYNPAVKGIARSNSRVQIKQNGVVFLEQNVPPGPFEFDQLNPPSNVGDVEVIVTDAGGGQEQFFLPYSNVGSRLNPGSFRYSIMLGQYQLPSGSEIYLAQGGVRYGWNQVFTPELDYFVSDRFVAGATGFVLENNWGSQFGSVALSKMNAPISASGYSLRLGLNSNIGKLGQFTFQRQQQSASYFDPSSALAYQTSTTVKLNTASATNSLSFNTNIPRVGAFSLYYSSQDTAELANASQNFNIGYSRGFDGFSVYASLNQSINNNGLSPTISSLSANLGVSIPLKLGHGGGNLSASASGREGGVSTQRVGYNGRWSDYASYGLSYGASGGASSASFASDITHAMGSSNIGLSQSSEGQTQFSIGNSGSLVLHRNGLLVGPSVGDTFGILEVPGGENIQAQGELGRVNGDGYGLVSNLNPYADNVVFLDTENSSFDLELISTSASVAPISGSVVRLAYKARLGYPLLLTFSRVEEIKIPLGADLFNDAGDMVGVSGRNSWAIAQIKEPAGTLTAKWGDKPEESCKAAYVLNKAVVDEAQEHKAIILKCETNKPIPIGSEIFDKSGEELAVTGQGGRALVRVKDTAGTLKVQWGVKSTETCGSKYAVDGNAKANSNGLIPLRLQCR